MSEDSAIVWFRDDLRLADNPALTAGSKSALLCVYIFDEESDGLRKLGGAARWFLHGALAALKEDLIERGGDLVFLKGEAKALIPDCAAALGAQSVFWNRRYDEAERRIDEAIKTTLKEKGVNVASFGANLLCEPWTLTGKTGKPFQIYTPYWRRLLAEGEPTSPLAKPRRLTFCAIPESLKRKAIPLDALALEPTKPDWAATMRETWKRGEAAAHQRLRTFLSKGSTHYARDRDRPDRAATSRLSPDLRFGTISPRQAWHAVSGNEDIAKEDRAKFLSELGWREFAYHLLYHHPHVATRNLRGGFESVPWRKDARAL
ncbi:MAG TPA: deoxyribodipyrimidine photo-lyase, partial [Methylovirgula sp.]